MKIKHLSADQMSVMSDAAISERIAVVSKVISRSYKQFLWRFIIGWAICTYVFVTASTEKPWFSLDLKVVLSVYCFALVLVVVYATMAMRRYVNFRNERESLTEISDMPAEVAVKALWFVETSQKAAAWRDSAIKAGRTLRSFDVEKLHALHKEEVGEEGNRTELVQRLHTCRD